MVTQKPEREAASSAVAKANQQLNKVALKLLDSKNFLYLRGTFPPKRGEAKPKRRRIALGIQATKSGVKVALGKAKQIEAECHV